MKKHLLAAAITVLAASSAFAQANDTLAKIKSSGTITLGVRESSGLSYTLGNGKYVGFHTEMAEHIVTDLQKQLGERLGALEVGRLESVRGFLGSASDAPPSKLVFFSPPLGAAAPTPAGAAGLQRLADWLRLTDAGLRAVLTDWLQGCYTTASLDEALACRAQLQAGEAIYLPGGHAVTPHSVGFYAQDSEQSGLLARAQEIEHLTKELRAQALMAEEARSALLRAESAYADAAQRLTSARRESTEAQSRAHELQVEHLRLSQLVEQRAAFAV